MTEPYYSDDLVTLYHGDCREIVDEIHFDSLVTDTPYGVGLTGRTTKHGARVGQYEAFVDTVDNVRDLVVPTVVSILDRVERAAVMPGVRCMWLYPKPADLGVVWSSAGAGMSSWGFNCSHPILYYGRDPFLAAGKGSRPNGMAWNNATEENGHPCPKPIKVMTWLVARVSLESDVVLDAYAGSGTTLVAAKAMGRKSVGVELSERYCEIAAKRLAQGVLDFGAAS